MTEDKDLERKKLDQDLRDLGYDPVVVGKKGDALARLCYENQLNRAIIDSQKRKLDECVKNHSLNIEKLLREERRRLLNDPRIKDMQSYLDAWAAFSNGDPVAKKLLIGFESLLKENEEGKP